MLRDERNFEIGEDENENKNVIDAERILDEVAGEEIQSTVRPLRLGHNQAEAERERHPKQTASRRRPHHHRTMAPLETGQTNLNGNNNDDTKRDHNPND